MRRFLLICVMVLPLLALHLGCAGESEPPRDPNFTPTDDPSDADHSMMPGPSGTGPVAPGQEDR